jgi:hypothetical protein
MGEVIDMPLSNDRDRVMRTIKARCGDVLTEDDLAALVQPEADTLPVAIAAEVFEVLEALEARMTELEERKSSW